MSGTNFSNGLASRKKYSGNADTDNDYALKASTKFVRKQAVIHCIGSEADNSEKTTAFTFPAKVIVHDVYINVLVADDTETVAIGTEGTSDDPDGFATALSLANLGIVYPTLLDGAVTRGALLHVITEAVTAAVAEPCTTCGGDPVSFTCSAGTDTAVFDIIIDYTEVVSEAN